MVTLSKIYTRGGDKGQTSLGDGSRQTKYDPRVEAYGTVDEANATLGIVRLHTQGELDALLGRIQNDLFDLGADLCTPEDARRRSGALRVEDSQITALEKAIDHYNEPLATLKSFILPGGSPAAAYLHLARTVTRRAERLTVALAEVEEINPAVVKYLNRLSDLLFVLSRHNNKDGTEDVLWIPGANR
jgi:cob(I)alamin adenosyltransferase